MLSHCRISVKQIRMNFTFRAVSLILMKVGNTITVERLISYEIRMCIFEKHTQFTEKQWGMS